MRNTPTTYEIHFVINEWYQRGGRKFKTLQKKETSVYLDGVWLDDIDCDGSIARLMKQVLERHFDTPVRGSGWNAVFRAAEKACWKIEHVPYEEQLLIDGGTLRIRRVIYNIQSTYTVYA